MTNNLSSKGPSLVAKMMGSNSKINSGACRLPLMWWRGRDGQMQNRLAIHHQDTQCGASNLPRGYYFPLNSPECQWARGWDKAHSTVLHRTPKPLYFRERKTASSLNCITEESEMHTL